MDIEKLKALAAECGFDCAGALDVTTLEFMPEVRAMCASDKCQKYGHSWSCPPACGELEEMRERAARYSRGLLVQTVTELEDSFDFEGMTAAGEKHAKCFDALWTALLPEYPEMFPMGTGGCIRCQSCTYPDAPCRFPDKLVSSMEALGLLVSRVCTDNGMKYNHGKNTLAYTACFLLE